VIKEVKQREKTEFPLHPEFEKKKWEKALNKVFGCRERGGGGFE